MCTVRFARCIPGVAQKVLGFIRGPCFLYAMKFAISIVRNRSYLAIAKPLDADVFPPSLMDSYAAAKPAIIVVVQCVTRVRMLGLQPGRCAPVIMQIGLQCTGVWYGCVDCFAPIHLSVFTTAKDQDNCRQ